MNINKIKKTIETVDDFWGVCQITQKGRILANVAKGWANPFEKILNKTNTSFGIASGTKGFTALAILKLIEEGRLSLSDNVFSILPHSFPTVKNRITIKHLLTHTSGIYDYLDEDIDDDFSKIFKKIPINSIRGPSDMLDVLTGGQSYFNPGEKFKYSNSGFVILGILIEVISKMQYTDFLTDNVIKPMGLKHTGCYRTNQLPENCAVGYIKDSSGNWYSNIFEIPLACTADGGLYTSADDVSLMWDNLLNGGFLSESLTNLAFTKHAHIKNNDYYGLGFYINCDKNKKNLSYSLVGSDPGVSFVSRYIIESRSSITIISNTEDGAWNLNKKIKEYL